MTKVFDALRSAGARTKVRTDSPVSCDVLLRGQAADDAMAETDGAGELERIRSILLGTSVSDFEQEVSRVEERLAVEEANLCTQISKLEQRIEGRLAEIDSRTSQAQSQLREQVLSQSNQLGDDSKKLSAQTLQLVNDGLDDLRQTKMDSAEFSKLLKMLAGHLVDRD